MSKPRIVRPAAEMPLGERRCTCCDRALKGKAAWLELDQRTDTYHDHEGVPPEQSQGWFAFGLTCATRLLKEQARPAGE